MIDNVTTIPEDQEIWKDIPGYEDYYQASNLGRIKGLKRTVCRRGNGNRISYAEKIMKPSLSEKGYLKISIRKTGKVIKTGVHRLVAITWVSNPNNLPEINHKDLNKSNNRFDNLEWVTRIDNMRHAFENVDIKRYRNETHPNSKRVGQYDKDGNLIREWPSVNETRREGWNFSMIARTCRGERKAYKGFIWKYLEHDNNKNPAKLFGRH